MATGEEIVCVYIFGFWSYGVMTHEQVGGRLSFCWSFWFWRLLWPILPPVLERICGLGVTICQFRSFPNPLPVLRRPILYFHSFRFFNDTCNLMNKGLQIFGFILQGVLVSACSTPISLPWMKFGWSKPGDTKSNGMFCVRVLEYVLKDGNSQKTSAGTTKKSSILNFCEWW